MASDPTQPGGPPPDGYRPGRQPDLLGDEEDADIPPPPQGAAADPLDEDAQDRLRGMQRRGRLLPGLLAAIAIGAFIAIVWWAYRTAGTDGAPGEVPVVQAEPGDEKVRPESEGGMEIPDQDKQIYEQLGSSEGQPEVERLMPPPEEPLAPPAPPPAEPAPDTAALTPPPAPQDVTPAPEEPAATAEAAPEASTDAPDAGAEPPAVAEVPTAPEAPTPAETAPAETTPAVEAPAAGTAAETPAPEPEAAPEPAPQVAAAGEGFRVQLAAVKSEADANAEWTKLQKAHADLLGGLKPTIQRADLGAQGIFYRIQGGPLASRDAAVALCDALKAKDQACLVVTP